MSEDPGGQLLQGDALPHLFHQLPLPTRVFRILGKHSAQGSAFSSTKRLSQHLKRCSGLPASCLSQSLFHLCTLFEALIIHFLFNLITEDHAFSRIFLGSLCFGVRRWLSTLSPPLTLGGYIHFGDLGEAGREEKAPLRVTITLHHFTFIRVLSHHWHLLGSWSTPFFLPF